jgi:hypothetical protein
MAIHREMGIFSDKIRQEKGGIPLLKMRIGIHTGPVVVRTLGIDLRVEFKAVAVAYEDLHWIDKSHRIHEAPAGEHPGGKSADDIPYRLNLCTPVGGKFFHSQITKPLSNRKPCYGGLPSGHKEIDSPLEELILEKTEGVPFFIEELIRLPRDLKIIERKGDKYYLARNTQDVIIPATIHDVIMARVDSLPEAAKGVLQTGSVVGRDFSHDLIRRLTGLPEQELLSQLSVLRDSELLYERGIDPQSTYIFKHALTQDAICQSLLKSTRQKHHPAFQEIATETLILLSPQNEPRSPAPCVFRKPER